MIYRVGEEMKQSTNIALKTTLKTVGRILAPCWFSTMSSIYKESFWAETDGNDTSKRRPKTFAIPERLNRSNIYLH